MRRKRINLKRITRLLKKYGSLRRVSKITAIPYGSLYATLRNKFDANILEIKKDKLKIKKYKKSRLTNNQTCVKRRQL